MHRVPPASWSSPGASSSSSSSSRPDPSGPGGPGPSPQLPEADWSRQHAEVAEAILRVARSSADAPIHAPLFKLDPGTPPGQPSGPRAPAGTGGRGLPVLQRTLSMTPTLSAEDARRAGGASAATGPALLLIKCPEGSGPRITELMRLFKAHDVRHMITLGTMPRGILPRSTLFANGIAMQDDRGHSWLATSTAERPFTAGQASTLTFVDSTRPPAGTAAGTPATTPAVPAEQTRPAPLTVQRLSVSLLTPELLEPSALVTIIHWLRTHTKPGDRVAVLAAEPRDSRRDLPDDPALMLMGGQLAMMLALQQTPALSAELRQMHHSLSSESTQRTALLTVAALDLNRLNPALLGTTLHLSAVLEAQQAWAELNARAAAPPAGGPFWMIPGRTVQGLGSAGPTAR